MNLAATIGRVERHTPANINERIQRDMECALAHYASRPEAIEDRLAELDHEWDIERTLEVQAGATVLVGLLFSVLRGRKWLGLSGISAYFLTQHAVQGWCPPVSVYRRLGVRTAHEIEVERTALKALRGDFGSIGEARDPMAKARAALEAAMSEGRIGRGIGRMTGQGRRREVRFTPMGEADLGSALPESEPGRCAAGVTRTRSSQESSARHGFTDGV